MNNITFPSPHKILKVIHETTAEYTFRVSCDKAVKHGQFFVLSIPKIGVSFERKMSCSVGKCGHCRINETYVCLEGPVFNYTKARELLD